MLRRTFLKKSSVAIAAGVTAPALSSAMLQADKKAERVQQKSYAPLQGPFRLAPEWHQGTVRRFQQALAERKLDAAIVSGSDNVNYLTGAFAVATQRPVWVVVPAEGELTVFYPGLDRDLWEPWWIKDSEWYFDFPHAGPFNQVVFDAGPKVDLFAWMLEGLKKRGLGTARVAFESGGDSEVETIQKSAPKMQPDWKTAEPLLLEMRQVKTAEEIALSRVSIELHDRMLEFAKDFILTHGTDATDFDVEHASVGFGASELARALPLDGRPHSGVGVTIGLSCRTGVATAYPHPNQFFYGKIKRGDAIQIATYGRVGGYGGEGYRAMQILPQDGKVEPQREKLWETHTAMTREQQRLMKAGVRCNQVAEGVLKLAHEAGVEKYVYHRPAHGEGSEGHQSPFLALGDNTVLRENMTFSNEPGLYNPAGGFGYNHSNLVRVTAEGGEQVNRIPLTREWCWVKI